MTRTRVSRNNSACSASECRTVDAVRRATPGRQLLLLEIEGVLACPVRGTGFLRWYPSAPTSVKRLMTESWHQVYLVTRREPTEVLANLEIPYARIIHSRALERSDQLVLWATQTRALLAQLPLLPGLHVQDQLYSVRLSPHKTVPDSSQPVGDVLRSLTLPSGWQLVEEAEYLELRPEALNPLGKVARLISRHAHLQPVFVGAHRTCEPTFREVQRRGGLGIKVGPEKTKAQYRLTQPHEVMELLHLWALA